MRRFLQNISSEITLRFRPRKKKKKKAKQIGDLVQNPESWNTLIFHKLYLSENYIYND